MHRYKRLVLSGILVSVLVLGMSCSMVPRGIQNLFATKTSTPTNTATSTPTPTVTPTPTKTPLPPVSIRGCTFIEDCPADFNLYYMLGYIPVVNSTNSVTVSVNDPAWVTVGWTAIDQTTLEENAQHIHWIFEIDRQDYFNPDWVGYGFSTDQDDSTITYPGIFMGATLTGWKVGESHQIRIGYSFDDYINNGWDGFPSGYEEVFTYNVRVVNPPTATPTLTPTNTPLPTRTFTPKPFIPKPPSPTPMPVCSVDSSIEIDNTTGGIVTLKLSGPTKYRFDLATGVTTLNVCSGSYSYQAWGCGGATDSGTINSGEAHEFYCN